jgi:hypothetical protein
MSNSTSPNHDTQIFFDPLFQVFLTSLSESEVRERRKNVENFLDTLGCTEQTTQMILRMRLFMLNAELARRISQGQPSNDIPVYIAATTFYSVDPHNSHYTRGRDLGQVVLKTMPDNVNPPMWFQQESHRPQFPETEDTKAGYWSVFLDYYNKTFGTMYAEKFLNGADDDRISSAIDQRNMLGEALKNLLIAIGVVRADAIMDGPELLLAASMAIEHFNAEKLKT